MDFASSSLFLPFVISNHPKWFKSPILPLNYIVVIVNISFYFLFFMVQSKSFTDRQNLNPKHINLMQYYAN
jgi:hypothetical protein